MTSFDWILLTIVAVSTITGLMGGFARVVVGLAAGIFAILLGFWFYRMPAAWFAEYFESKTAASVLGFLVIFVTVMIAGGLLGRLLASFFKWAGLTWLDRLLGILFGFVRGMVIVTGIVTVVTAFAPNPPPRWMSESQMMPYATGTSRVLSAVAPREMKEKFDENLERIKKLWADRLTPPATPSESPEEKPKLKPEAQPKLKKESY